MSLHGQSIDHPLRSYIVSRVDEALDEAFELFNLETLSVKDTLAEEIYFKTFDEHVKFKIGKLCKTCISLLDIEYEGGIHQSIAEESKKLHLIWEVLRRKVEARIGILVENYLKTASESSDGPACLVQSWARVLSNFQNFITRILPSLEYVIVNYPTITKEVTRRLQISDYFVIYLINLLKIKLSEDLEPFLEKFLLEQRSHKTLDKKYLECISPLALMHRYKISVDQNQKLQVNRFYLQSVQAYAAKEINIPIDLNYRENLTKLLVRDALVSGSISASLVASSNDVILQHTILDKDTTYRLIKIVKDNVKLGVPSHTDIQARQLFATILMSYESRSMLDDLWSIYRALIFSTLTGVRGVSSNEKLLIDACELLEITHQSELLKDLAFNEVRRSLDGTIVIMERYLKLCESTIRKFNQAELDGNPLEFIEEESLELNLPVLMKLPPSILTIYSRSLFRRFIMHGPVVIDSLTSSSFFEHHLLSQFERLYGTSPEYDGLQTLKTELQRSAQLAYNFDATEAAPIVRPLVLERKNVPSVIEENLVNDILLPDEMRHGWNEFQRFYLHTDSKATYKKLQLIDNLQHCEVQTQIRLSDGSFLLLDLTLYQTCILMLFDDEDTLSVDDIFARSKIPVDLVNGVLESFMRINLLKPCNGSIVLNENFVPDECKLKNNRLRVAIATPKGKCSKKRSFEITQHIEGQSSHWAQEIIKACIVRSLKGEKTGLKFDSIYAKVESQMFGISMGEFKDALERTVLEKSITRCKNLYKY